MSFFTADVALYVVCCRDRVVQRKTCSLLSFRQLTVIDADYAPSSQRDSVADHVLHAAVISPATN